MIKSQQDLINTLGVTDQVLNQLIKFKSDYKEWKKPKKSIGFRKIVSPPLKMKIFQRKISDYLMQYVNTNFAYGGISKQDRVRIVGEIRISKMILVFDIKDCFPSIKFTKIKNKLIEIGFTYKYAVYFSKISTYKNKLPQGSPCSTTVANLILNDLDVTISTILPKGSKYFRWVDDVIVTFNFVTDKKYNNKLINKISKVVNGFDYQIKNNIEIYRTSQIPNILGLTIYKKINVNKTWYKNFRAQLHNAKYKMNLTQKELDSLRGKVSTLKHVTKKSKNKNRIKFINKAIFELNNNKT